MSRDIAIGIAIWLPIIIGAVTAIVLAFLSEQKKPDGLTRRPRGERR